MSLLSKGKNDLIYLIQKQGLDVQYFNILQMCRVLWLTKISSLTMWIVTIFEKKEFFVWFPSHSSLTHSILLPVQLIILMLFDSIY